MNIITSRILQALIVLGVIWLLSIINIQEVMNLAMIITPFTIFKFVFRTATYILFKILKWVIIIAITAFMVTIIF